MSSSKRFIRLLLVVRRGIQYLLCGSDGILNAEHMKKRDRCLQIIVRKGVTYCVDLIKWCSLPETLL